MCSGRNNYNIEDVISSGAKNELKAQFPREISRENKRARRSSKFETQYNDKASSRAYYLYMSTE